MNKHIVIPILFLSGTIIGAGIFGLPFAFYNAGLYAGIITMLVLGIIVTALHLIYADIIIHTPGNHRLAGYANHWLGKNGSIPAIGVNIVSLLGGLAIYLVLGSNFLASALSTNTMPALLISWLFFSLSILFGINFFRSAEWIITLVIVALVLAIFITGSPSFQIENISSSTSPSDIFLLYGVVLFALAGSSALPEMKEYFTDKKRTFSIITLGTFLPATLYILFIVGIWGLSQGAISEDALSGVRNAAIIKFIGYILGFLAITTSYWTLSTNLKNLLSLDLALTKKKSVVVALLAPIFIILIAKASFVTLMSLVGAVVIGLEVLIILLIYHKMRRQIRTTYFRLTNWALAMLAMLYILGILGNIFS